MVKSWPADPGARLATGDPHGPLSNLSGLRYSGRSTETGRLGVCGTRHFVNSAAIFISIVYMMSFYCRVNQKPFVFFHVSQESLFAWQPLQLHDAPSSATTNQRDGDIRSPANQHRDCSRGVATASR